MSLPLKPITRGILHGGAWTEILSSGVINSYPQADKDKKKAEPNRQLMVLKRKAIFKNKIYILFTLVTMRFFACEDVNWYHYGTMTAHGEDNVFKRGENFCQNA